MCDEVAIELHHGGYLSSEPPYKYDGRIVHIVINVDPDRISYLDLIELVEKLGYPSSSKIYYKVPNGRMEDKLVLIVDDKQVMEMVEAYKGIEMWVIYVKARISPINRSGLEENVKGNGNRQDDGQNEEDGNQRSGAVDDNANNAHVGGERSDQGEEATVSGPNEDNDDINSDDIMKNLSLKPWMLDGLEGLGDDDIFILRKEPNIASIFVTSPMAELQLIGSKKQKKSTLKTMIEKGKDHKTSSSTDEDLESEEGKELLLAQATNENALP